MYWERKLIVLSYGAHIVSSVAIVWITKYLYGYGDMLTYHYHGAILADLLRYDFVRFFPDVVALLLHQSPQLPVPITGAGSSTGAMTGLAGLFAFALGDSLYATCLLLGTLSMFGKLGVYRALSRQLSPDLKPRAMVGALMVPSAVFWTSGLVKEAVAVVGIGALVLGMWSLDRPTRLYGVILAIIGTAIVGMVKAYILFAFVCAYAVWWYWEIALHRSGGRAVSVRPGYLLVAIALAVGGVVLLGQAFPDYSPDHVLEQAAGLQEVGAQTEGGSNYGLIEEDAASDSVTTQILYSPLALLTALFRPAIVEVNNGLMLVNALETTTVLLILLGAIWRNSWTVMWIRLRSSSIFMFCLTFTFVFGIAVGLASTNLGTLSRYRVPFMPFFVTLVLAWSYAPRRTSPRLPVVRVASSTRAGGRPRSQTVSESQ